jgi:pyrroloquinoline quinone biosynthesis protein B
VIVRVLGSAAGGGVPQWNCACNNCNAAREGRQPRRTQSSLALSPDGKRWLLLNCSPDIAAQIETFAPLQPAQRRKTPITGILLTDANVDHLGGLTVLRQHGDHKFSLRSSAAVRAIAIAQPAFAPFSRAPHRWLEVPLDAASEAVEDQDLVGNQLVVRAIPVAGMTPGYDGRHAIRGAVVAYEISARGRDDRLLFAPIFGDVDETLRRAIDRAKIAFLDGSFYTNDELIAQGLADKSARSLGHQPIGGPDGTLERVRGVGARIIFTHVNNSNPMLDPGSSAAARVRELGAEIAFDGMELSL